jgi:serine/threonine protein kinase
LSASGVGRKFQFIREIASGGFGSVYLAKVIHGDGFQRLAAVKLLHPKWSENEEIAARMRDEARLLGWLRHKHIVEVIDLTRIAGRVAVIMEYLEAVDLRVAMQGAAASDAPIPLSAALEICAAVASALDAAYNRPPYAGEKPLRVIHRDIKPSNIMVDTSGTVKVLDFGTARADFAERESRTEEMSFGSVDYMPPERMFFEPETPTSDVYSLGATLFEVLALEKFGKAKLRGPQHDESFEERWGAVRRNMSFPSVEIERDTRQLLREMLAFDHHDRPSAADCVLRMRTLSRRSTEPGVGEWAERVIPPLVQMLAEKKRPKHADSLVDRVVPEDTHSFRRDDETSEAFDHGRPSAATRPEDRADLDHSGRLSDQQWQKLKQATLAELEPPKPMARGGARNGLAGAAETKGGASGFASVKGAGGLVSAKPPPGMARPTRPDPGSTLRPGVMASVPAITPPKTTPARPTPAQPVEPRGTVPPIPPKIEAPPPSKTMVMAPMKRAPIEESVTSWSQRPVRGAPIADTPTEADERQALPPEAPDDAPPPARGGGMRIFLALSVITLVVGVAVLATGGVAAVGGYWYVNAEAPAPEPEPAAEPFRNVRPPPPKKIDGPHVSFKSLLPRTAKMAVSCKSGRANGGIEVGVAGDTPGDCTVTAVTADRKPFSATVKAAKAVNYVCFAKGEKTCVEKP